jgi:hypothetical protein
MLHPSMLQALARSRIVDAQREALRHSATGREPAYRPRDPLVAGRRAILWTIVCALLASAIAGVPPAGAKERTQVAQALAQERYYSSYGEPETIDARTSAAEAQERYYSSFGEAEPRTVAPSPKPSDPTPWLPIALSVAVALAVVATGATRARRLHVRRRHTRVTT